MEDPEELKRITENSNVGSSVRSKEELMQTIQALGIQKATKKL